MRKSANEVAADRAAGGRACAGVSRAMLSVDDVARMLGCSSRHVHRLVDAGRMPRPVKLGALVRWSREAIDAWIRGGCPDCRRAPCG